MDPQIIYHFVNLAPTDLNMGHASVLPFPYILLIGATLSFSVSCHVSIPHNATLLRRPKFILVDSNSSKRHRPSISRRRLTDESRGAARATNQCVVRSRRSSSACGMLGSAIFAWPSCDVGYDPLSFPSLGRCGQECLQQEDRKESDENQRERATQGTTARGLDCCCCTGLLV
jgi:hypothetical protein